MTVISSSDAGDHHHYDYQHQQQHVHHQDDDDQQQDADQKNEQHRGMVVTTATITSSRTRSWRYSSSVDNSDIIALSVKFWVDSVKQLGIASVKFWANSVKHGLLAQDVIAREVVVYGNVKGNVRAKNLIAELMTRYAAPSAVAALRTAAGGRNTMAP